MYYFHIHHNLNKAMFKTASSYLQQNRLNSYSHSHMHRDYGHSVNIFR